MRAVDPESSLYQALPALRARVRHWTWISMQHCCSETCDHEGLGNLHGTLLLRNACAREFGSHLHTTLLLPMNDEGDNHSFSQLSAPIVMVCPEHRLWPITCLTETRKHFASTTSSTSWQ